MVVGEAMAEPALEAKGLTKHYRRGALALSDVSPRVASGSITAIAALFTAPTLSATLLVVSRRRPN